MRLLIIPVLLISLFQTCFGQIYQKGRFELPQKFSETDPVVFSLETEGLLVVQDSRDFESRKRIRKYIQLDTAMNIHWAAQVAVPEEEELAGYEYAKNIFRLLYTHRQHEDLKGSIISLDLRQQTVVNDPFNIQLGMKLTHFTIAGNSSIIGGQVGLQPMIALFDHETKRSRIVPGFFLAETELIDVRANRNQTFSILQLQKKGKEKTMIYRAFDPQGNQLVEDRFVLEQNMIIQSAISSTLLHGEVMVAGVYTFGNSGPSAGIFSVILNPLGEKKITYTDFPMLDHFLDYMPEKRAEKIIRKAANRRNSGNVPDFRIAVSLHRLDEYPFGFLIFGESFQIPGNTQNSLMTMGPSLGRPNLYGYPYASSGMPWRYGYDPFAPAARLISEVRMTNCFAVAFDLKGKYIWDESVSLDQLSMPSDIQVSDYIPKQNRVEFLFLSDKGLGYSTRPKEEDKKKTTMVQAMLPGEGQTLLFESNLEHTVRKWYDSFAYVFGIQTLRGTADKGEEEKKRIFFINKIKAN